jgi:hypothetical protein
MTRPRRFFQPRPKGPEAVEDQGTGAGPQPRPTDPVLRARRTQLLFLALALLLTVGLLTMDVRSTDTYGFALLAVRALRFETGRILHAPCPARVAAPGAH